MSDKPTLAQVLDRFELAYAENKHQNPAWLKPGDIDDPLAMRHFFDPTTGRPLCGHPSYIAVADGHTVLDLMCYLAETFRQNYTGNVPYITIVGKHANPCGAAIDWGSPLVALNKALYGNPVAAMGGELITNFALTDELGQAAYAPEKQDIGRKAWGMDVILAPDASATTVELMGKKEKRRILVNPHLAAPFMPREQRVVKILRGGDQLVQGAPNFILTRDKIIGWGNGRPLEGADFDTLLLVQCVVWRASSNTVGIGKDRSLKGLGCGRMDRICCTRLAIDEANLSNHDTRGSVFASDAFFPFATGNLPDIRELLLFDVTRQKLGLPPPHADDDTRTFLKKATDIWHLFMKLDRREAAELLIDAGCIGGVVPKDGKNFAEVEALFREAGLSVAFVAPENRGFSKH